MLLIEDDDSFREIIEQAFSSGEFHVETVRVGIEGVERAKQLSPHIILLDIMLPDIDGFEVLRRIKEDEVSRKCQVVLLSNLEGVGDVERALALGATTYLVKSRYTPAEIVERVRMALKEGNELRGA